MAGKRLQRPADNEGWRITAHPAAGASSQHLKPKFSLEHLDRTFCLSACTRDEKAAFADRLHELSQLTWRDIAGTGRHGQGSETIARSAIRSPIPACITEDVRIIAFRCIGKAPMVGYRVDEVFFVVWIDRGFSLYNHG
ncbi:hypothetical protein [Sphaerotilus sp.]|uniref:hypothetical protein n=1 Tax=Sphaerotilus sp. TaxID=2093942 RepID=UPI002ACD40AE|nr:hypothetical protein [Sphaerotilus sp.]MDZ7857846.1 hypothetical protein [Sphaerotilus sp.]